MSRSDGLPVLVSYPVWDLPTRWFHWLNFLCVVAMSGSGLVILNAGALDISNSGKVLLKTLHGWTGYAFVINLGVRMVWAFTGNHYARWQQFVPIGKTYMRELRVYLRALVERRSQHYLGHNPIGRIAVMLLFLTLWAQALTGLFLAGTDLYLPPFGHWIAQWIAAPGVDPTDLVPYSPDLYDKAAFAEMRALREPFASLHLYAFFVLAGLIVLHVAGVIAAELRERSGLVSSMFTGDKVLGGEPVDVPDRRRAAGPDVG